MNYIEIVFLCVGALSGIVVTALYMYQQGKIQALSQRLKQLEEVNRQRLPWKSAEDIEDATAVLLYAAQEADVLKYRIRAALDKVRDARNPDRPPGARITPGDDE